MASAETDTSSFPSEEKECGTLKYKEILLELKKIINSSDWDLKDGKKEMVILGAKIQILISM